MTMKSLLQREQDRRRAEKAAREAPIDYRRGPLECGFIPEIAHLVGGKIVNIGFHPDADQPTGDYALVGGLVIDWEREGVTTRTVLSFNDLGMTMAWEGELASRERID
jgi:hypothetical protein